MIWCGIGREGTAHVATNNQSSYLTRARLPGSWAALSALSSEKAGYLTLSCVRLARLGDSFLEICGFRESRHSARELGRSTCHESTGLLIRLNSPQMVTSAACMKPSNLSFSSTVSKWRPFSFFHLPLKRPCSALLCPHPAPCAHPLGPSPPAKPGHATTPDHAARNSDYPTLSAYIRDVALARKLCALTRGRYRLGGRIFGSVIRGPCQLSPQSSRE